MVARNNAIMIVKIKKCQFSPAAFSLQSFRLHVLTEDEGFDLIKELRSSSWRQADVHRTSAFRWVRIPHRYK